MNKIAARAARRAKSHQQKLSAGRWAYASQRETYRYYIG